MLKVLFLGQEKNLRPWYDDVVAAATGRVDLHLWDRGKPLAPQFESVGAVVDQGGVVGTREMMDIAAANGARLWQVLGTGLDHVDVKYALEKGLTLCNTPGQFSAIALAEHAMFQMLYFAKNYPATQKSVRNGVLCSPMVEELGGKNLALVGFGASAKELATRARAFGMRLLAVDVMPLTEGQRASYGLDYYGKPSQLDDILVRADYVSLHLPLTSKTRHLIGKATLQKMKPTAVLVNVARGEIVDEDALYDALSTGKLRGAGLDVFSHEPVDPNHRLLKLENVFATPHLAGVTNGTSRRRAEAVVDNLQRIARGDEVLYRITAAE